MSAYPKRSSCSVEARLRTKAHQADKDLATVARRMARQPESPVYARALGNAQRSRSSIRELLTEHRESCPACELQTEPVGR